MSFNRKVLLNKSTALFKPKIIRTGLENLGTQINDFESISSFNNTNIESSSSFRYFNKDGLISTQQVKIDYSKFENHTFFHSAVAKTNEAFDKIINYFPFDGEGKEIEDFEDNLTGFEKYIYKNINKNVGYVTFTGSNEPSPFIKVDDSTGAKYPSISRNKKGDFLLDPQEKPFTVELNLKIPNIQNQNQIIFQKINKDNERAYNLTLGLESSSDVNSCNIFFGISSGSNYLHTSGQIAKGNFNHIAAIYDKNSSGDQKLYLRVNHSTVYSSSIGQNFGSLNYSNKYITIGSGSQCKVNGSVFTPAQNLSGSIDELRYFKSARLPSELLAYSNKNLDFNAESSNNHNIVLNYRFNEPSGDYEGNSIVFDYSGNSLHSSISNFNTKCRLSGSDIPLTGEDLSKNLILFPNFSKTLSLNTQLMTTASFYDAANPNLITKLVPPHYFDEGNQKENFSSILGTFNKNFSGGTLPNQKQSNSAQLLVIFLLVWAKFFDEIKIFIDSITHINNLSYDNYNVPPDVFLKEIGRINGIDLPPMFRGSNVDQLFNGVDIIKEPGKSQIALIEIQNIIWRRILASLPFLRKSKGTMASIKSIFRSTGIEPDNLFLFREYSGNTKNSIENIRENKNNVFQFLNFSGSLAILSSTTDAQGRPNNKPTLKSNFLSSSRIEIGNPKIKGSFVNAGTGPNQTMHGISNNKSDGILTSGSFTFEGHYYFDQNVTHYTTQSLARIHTSGSYKTGWEGLISNLIYNKNQKKLTLSLYDSVSLSKENLLFLTGVNIINNKIYNVSFGYDRLNSTPSSGSLFLRVGRQESGELYDFKSTSSLVPALDNSVLRNISISHNNQGPFLCIGSQSINNISPTLFLRKSSNSDVTCTDFSGFLGNIKYFSKKVSENEFKEHVKNPTSFGNNKPFESYFFDKLSTGSYEKIRLLTDFFQATTSSNSSGEIKIFDFSKNDFHLNGKGFESNKMVFKTIKSLYTMLSSNFDISIADKKVRIRSFKSEERANNDRYAEIGPVYAVNEYEKVVDDPRFSIDMSVMKGLNEQIMKIFSDYDFLSTALGKTNLFFGEFYPDLVSLRRSYFEIILEKINLGKYSELFKWIDNSLTNLVFDMIPHTTKFMGINFVYENHVLERNKYAYFTHNEIYSQKSNITSTYNNTTSQGSNSNQNESFESIDTIETLINQ